MFRRAPTPQVQPLEPLERRYQLNLIPECSLFISNGPERRKHLALIGESEWAQYWFLDALAQSPSVNLPSFIVSGPADHQLRHMPQALDLPATLCEVRRILPHTIDPASFRQRMDSFLNFTSETQLSLLLMGRDLTHVWPFILGKKAEFQNRLMFVMADMTPNLKLPLSESFRYFLVQDSHQAQFMKAVERWHRHDSDKPRFEPMPVTRKNCTLYEVKDPL